MEPRKAEVNLTYIPRGETGNDSAAEIKNYLESFSYTDPASGESDTISVTLNNMDMRWANTWLPVTGDKLEASIQYEGQILNCGKFCCDDLSFSGPNLTCSIGGVSVPENQDFHCTERTYTWQVVTLEEMASAIAARYGLTLVYDAPVINIESLEQDSKTDSDFLNTVCGDYGMNVKVYYGQLIIYDLDDYESKEAIAKFSVSDFEQWDCQTSLTGTYTGAVITYTREDDDTEISVGVGTPGRILNINEKADNEADAVKKAVSKVNEENRSAVTMTAKLIGNLNIASGSCIEIVNSYAMDGKYFVDKVTHDIGSGYTISLDLYRIQDKVEAVEVDADLLLGVQNGE
ncbi:MAG: hypothetical protein LUD72_05770 [Bacteroidales bacterium]|nr:hypothetical protein [Bacteroidales bacterium]